MEYLRIKFAHFSFHTITAAIARPDIVWRAIIIGASALLLVLGVFGFLAHAWATHTAPVTLPPGVNREDVTAEDIRRVLEVYTTKQTRFNDLRKNAPVAPILVAGKTSLTVEEINELATSSESVMQ